MSEELLMLVSNCARTFLIVFTNITLYFFLLTNILKRKCGFSYFVYWGLSKVILRDLLMTIILPYYYDGEYWLQIWNVVSVLIFTLLATICHFIMIESEFIRFAVVNVFCEMLATFCGFFCLAIVNMLEGRDSLWEVGLFQGLDLIYPILATGVVMVIWHYAKPLLLRFRTCRLPFSGFLWAAYIFYMSVAVLSTFTSIQNFGAASLLCTLIVMLIFLLFILMTVRYRNQLYREMEFLNSQIRLYKTHYNTVRNQMEEIEQKQKRVETQMKQIEHNAEFVENSQFIEDYIEQLKDSFKEIKAGIYCNDQAVDSILFSQKQLYGQKGIRLWCVIQEYDRGQIEEKDIIECMMCMFHYGLSGEEVEFQTAQIKNYLVLHMVLHGSKARSFSFRGCRSVVEKYEGNIQVIKERDRKELIVTLKNR